MASFRICLWLHKIPSWLCTMLSLSFYVDGHLGWSHSPAIVNSASVNMDVQVSLWEDLESFNIFMHAVIGSYAYSISLRKLHTDFSYWEHKFIFSPKVKKGVPSSASSSAFISLFLFSFINLVFYKHLHMYILFVEHSFSPFPITSLFILTISLKEVFLTCLNFCM